MSLDRLHLLRGGGQLFSSENKERRLLKLSVRSFQQVPVLLANILGNSQSSGLTLAV